MEVIGLESLLQRSKSFKEAYPPSATTTILRFGCQHLTKSSNCQARDGDPDCHLLATARLFQTIPENTALFGTATCRDEFLVVGWRNRPSTAPVRAIRRECNKGLRAPFDR